MIKRVAVIGAGNAGCITALYYNKYLKKISDDYEISIYHSPVQHPMERVGQGTLIEITALISEELGVNWYNNTIDATFKTAFMYEGWGKKQYNIFAPFKDMAGLAMHFVPQKLSKAVLESGYFNVNDKTIINPEKEIDADVIFDCRGRNNRDRSNYSTLTNPVNSVLLGDKPGRDYDLIYTRCVATKNGWTFIVPNKDSVSYGYLYNSNITSKEDAKNDFLNGFELPEVNGELQFENYVAKNMFVGERTILQGNRCGFVEPMESTSLSFYLGVCELAWDAIFGNQDLKILNNKMRKSMKEIETFILWHYQFGSKYDTPFWDYAKSLSFTPDEHFQKMIHEYEDDRDNLHFYGQWTPFSFKDWAKGVGVL